MRPPSPPRVSSRDQKLNQLASMQEADQRQQQLDQQATAQSASQGQAAQTGLLQMLTGLYGLQNEQELNPLKQGLIQAQTSGQNIENQYKPGLFQAQTAAEQNRGDLYGREKTNDPLFDQYAKAVQLGIVPQGEASKYRSIDEYYGAQKAGAAAKNQAQYGELENQFRTGQIAPTEYPDVVNKFGPENLEYMKGLMPPPKPAAQVTPSVGEFVHNQKMQDDHWNTIMDAPNSPPNLIKAILKFLSPEPQGVMGATLSKRGTQMN